jgi:hypothetical protein
MEALKGDPVWTEYLSRLQAIVPAAARLPIEAEKNYLAAYVILNEARKEDEHKALQQEIQALPLVDEAAN